jgi:itaconyl-CoA hydratase
MTRESETGDMMFPAYVPVGKDRYRERFGLDFEDFRAGQHFRHRPGYTITQQDNIDDCMDTLNQAMLHYDARYAAQTEFSSPLMVTTAMIQRLIGMTWKTFNRRKAIIRWDHITMKAPIFAGDTLYSESRIMDTSQCDDAQCGKVTIMTYGINQKDIVFCEMQYDSLIYRKKSLPFSENNY